ncbi:MAG TPA: glycoside hydrolase domain-containing protein, partial [Phycisphaerae bacterium]|nr:glycoside hydrolase domain-containing protein [Phycisphaerae bacterium]
MTVLDPSCPVRCYYRFATDMISPAPLTAQGEQLLGKGAYDRLRQTTLRSVGVSANDSFAVFRPSPLVLREARKVGTIAALAKHKQPAASRGDWHGLVFRRMFFDPYTAPPPPADWADPTFDDAAWAAASAPFQADLPEDLPPSATAGNMRTVHVNVLQYIGSGIHAACYRATFLVADPARAGNLTFRATYRGGLRVLVNGREVARGHLPKGGLPPETPGEDYPPAAYTNAAGRDRALGPVTIPASMLRRGVNVLAMEVRAALLHPTVLKKDLSRSWNALHDREGLWRHGYLGRFSLTSPDGSVGSARTRPPGLCVWVEDMHRRVRSDDVPPAAEGPGVLRLVGPRNGSCSAQLVLGTDRDIAAVKATVTDLQPAAGGTPIPASAVRVFHMMPYPEDGFSEKLGDERGLEGSFPTQAQLRQYASMPEAGRRYIFDQITEQPQPLPAGRSRPLWISLRIPPDAPAGVYRGTLRCQADGVPEVQVPVEAEVVRWRLGDPKDFQTYVGLEQNPYGIAKQYGVAAWSDAHFKLLEASFGQMARAGASWLNVPVIRRTEFGNGDDSMIRWVRKRDGSLSYDFTVLDRYLDLAVRHLGRVRMINLVVMPGLGAADTEAVGEIMVTDEATGATSPLPASGSTVTLDQKRRIWLPFATALYRHLQARGLDKAMHWGYPLDAE